MNRIDRADRDTLLGILAKVGIDFIFAVTLIRCAIRACISTRPARNAVIIDKVRHFSTFPCFYSKDYERSFILL